MVLKSESLQVGLALPTSREGLAYPSGMASVKFFRELAIVAENSGFDSLWANDHLATPRSLRGSLEKPPNFYEPLVVFAYIAGVTDRVRLVVGAVAAPLRAPLLLAKQVATLDQLSGGRFVLALGLGAYREEFELVAGPRANVARGVLVEETLEALRSLFDREASSYQGTEVAFEDVEMYPHPFQVPFPIYLSGDSVSAIKRAARLGDGWLVTGTTPEVLEQKIAVLNSAAREAGRDPGQIEVCVQLWVALGEDEGAAADLLARSQHFRRLAAREHNRTVAELQEEFCRTNLFGSAESVREQIMAYAEAGADHISLVFLSASQKEMLDAVQQFSTEILPVVRQPISNVVAKREEHNA